MTRLDEFERVLDPNDQDDAIELLEFFRGLDQLNSPWHGNVHIIDACRRRLAEIKAEADKIAADGLYPSHLFAKRDSEGWYLSEICAFATIVEKSIREGRPWEAANRAMLLGDRLCELRLSTLWNEDAMFGKKRLGELRDGAQMQRKGSAEERILQVDTLNNAGHSKSAAFKIVGKRQGVTAGAIRKDYYKNKLHTTVE